MEQNKLDKIIIQDMDTTATLDLPHSCAVLGLLEFMQFRSKHNTKLYKIVQERNSNHEKWNRINLTEHPMPFFAVREIMF